MEVFHRVNNRASMGLAIHSNNNKALALPTGTGGSLLAEHKAHSSNNPLMSPVLAATLEDSKPSS